MNFQGNLEYANVRGFNVHGDWGCNGTTEWINFDAERYKKMIQIGKERFPGMNTVRIWFSIDAYKVDKARYLKAIQSATWILSEAGLQIMPVYFNGWFGMPHFGGFVPGCVKPRFLRPYEVYLEDSVNAVKDANILMHDIANEPFNAVYGSQSAVDTVVEFLDRMIQIVRRIDDHKITVGSQGMPDPNNKQMCDISRLTPLVDVLSLHPYNSKRLPKDEFEKYFTGLLKYAETYNKPYIISECVWGAPDADGRKHFLETELEVYAKYNVGFLAHALFTSPVADLHPIEESLIEGGLYMAFLDRDFNIRKHHDIFNRL